MSQRPDFREATRYFRERTRALAHVHARGRLGILTIGGLIAAFIAISGGFGSHGITPELRLAVIGIAAAAIIATAFATRSLLTNHLRLANRPFPLGVLQVGLLTPAAAVLCWAIAALFQGEDTPSVWNFLGPCFLTIASAETLLQVLHRKPATATANPAQPTLSSRLPAPLRHADIFAVEAEDHYLRIHTSAGDMLLPMRFADALTLLRDEPGAQTHRSWWVARSAVVSVKRGNGRARLSLVNGLEVPASRQFARRLREEGWY